MICDLAKVSQALTAILYSRSSAPSFKKSKRFERGNVNILAVERWNCWNEKAVYLKYFYQFHWLPVDKVSLLLQTATLKFHTLFCSVPAVFNTKQPWTLNQDVHIYLFIFCSVYITCILYYNSHFLNWLETYWLDKRGKAVAWWTSKRVYSFSSCFSM